MDKCAQNKKPFLFIFSVRQPHDDRVVNVAKNIITNDYDMIVQCLFCQRKTVLSSVDRPTLAKTVELFPKAFNETTREWVVSNLIRRTL